MRQASEESACLHSSVMIKLASVSIFHTYSLATKMAATKSVTVVKLSLLNIARWSDYEERKVCKIF